MNSDLFLEAEKKNYVSQKTNAVYDSEFNKLLLNLPWKEWFQQRDPLRCRPEYLQFYKQWILSSKLNQVMGLDQFQQTHLINGTTQTFDELYQRYAGQRLRIFRGEYAYHKRAYNNFEFIEDSPLDKNDFVIISSPFCSTGDIHPDYAKILDEAQRLGVDVHVDCAYFGTCYDLTIDVSHPVIKSVSFSLTKGTGLGDIRSGIRFSNYDDNFPIAQQNRYEHTILAAAKIGLYMMQNLSPDFIPFKYQNWQKDFCRLLGLQPSKCIHLALGDARLDRKYLIEEKYYRIGIREGVRSLARNQLELSEIPLNRSTTL